MSFVHTLMHGFFGNIQYAAIAPSIFTMKLSKHRCLECSTWAIFLCSSFTVSIIALLRNNTLSETLINVPFILFFNLVMSCIPFTKSLWKSSFPIYPLSATSLPYMNSINDLYSNGWHDFGEEMAKMFAYHFKIEVLETPETRIMEQYHDKHDFSLWHGGFTMVGTLVFYFQHIFCSHLIKKLAEIICHTK